MVGRSRFKKATKNSHGLWHGSQFIKLIKTAMDSGTAPVHKKLIKTAMECGTAPVHKS